MHACIHSIKYIKTKRKKNYIANLCSGNFFHLLFTLCGSYKNMKTQPLLGYEFQFS